MALAFSMPGFIFGDVHDKPRDGTHRDVSTRAISRAVLGFLVVRFPTPSQFEAGRLAVRGVINESLHSALLQMTVERESRLRRQQCRHSAQRNRLNEEGGLIEKT